MSAAVWGEQLALFDLLPTEPEAATPPGTDARHGSALQLGPNTRDLEQHLAWAATYASPYLGQAGAVALLGELAAASEPVQRWAITTPGIRWILMTANSSYADARHTWAAPEPITLAMVEEAAAAAA